MVALASRVHTAFAKACKKALSKVDLKDFVRPLKKDEEGEEEKTDAKENSAAVKLLMKNMRGEVKKAFPLVDIQRTSDRAANLNIEHSKKEFKRLQIDVREEPKLKWLIDGWRKDNVARITNMNTERLDRIETILDEGYGSRWETIAEKLEQQIEGVDERRAELIARDQVLTLNAQITRERMVAADIDSYVWTTSNDERVREEHEALEGQVFTWESGGDPEEGHPGEPINCRCTAFPILPELEGGGEEEPEE